MPIHIGCLMMVLKKKLRVPSHPQKGVNRNINIVYRITQPWGEQEQTSTFKQTTEQ